MAELATELRVSFASGLAGVRAEEWDALFDPAYPFTRHAFLLALEKHGCVGGDTGWDPCHLLLRDARGTLAGAAPLYRKYHSYGEFVFDFSWAQASARMGSHYYPKLLCAIPFVPSAGPRLGASSAAGRTGLIRAISELVERDRCSSAHLLFAPEADRHVLSAAGWLERQDVQFQWHNHGFADFAGFAAALTSEKRKKMLRERRRVTEAGIRFETRPGDALSEAEWMQVYDLYANTYEERGQPPYLTPGFFLDYARAGGSPFRIILGYLGSRMVAAALTLEGGDTLYGRHWGAAGDFHSLHFECCYHQGIEYCIRAGLLRYDAGTQGEHKLARGFEPVLTYSFHTLAQPQLSAAVDDFLQRERKMVAQRQGVLVQHSPYRSRVE